MANTSENYYFFSRFQDTQNLKYFLSVVYIYNSILVARSWEYDDGNRIFKSMKHERK